MQTYPRVLVLFGFPCSTCSTPILTPTEILGTRAFSASRVLASLGTVNSGISVLGSKLAEVQYLLPELGAEAETADTDEQVLFCECEAEAEAADADEQALCKTGAKLAEIADADAQVLSRGVLSTAATAAAET